MIIMKKSVIFIVSIFASLQIQAQDYLISFAGSGETTEVSTIQVSNLTSGASVFLNGGDILHLIPALGICTNDSGNGSLQLYPNPVAEQSIFTFFAPEAGTAEIYIVDPSGKTLSRLTRQLPSGTHRFRVSGINSGIYFLRIAGENYNYSTKLVSHTRLQSDARIEYLSSVNNSSGNQPKSISATIDMPYTNGNTLIYKGTSGEFSAIVTDVPTGSKTITFPFISCTDSDGNHYATVQIGDGKFSQFWMAENLKVGVGIDITQLPADNGIIEYYCYEDNLDLCATYGGLYKWDEMMNYTGTEGSGGICPVGWHVPTNQEFYDLESFLGGMSVAGGKLKETGTEHWNANNVGATNETGFTALPGGELQSWGPVYGLLGIKAYFWSSSPGIDGGSHFYMALTNGSGTLYRNNDPFGSSYSVRCIHD
jgi:uncharacterized protein (TIGR02145 family)